MARKTNDITNANRWLDKGNLKVVFTFRTQQLYDLWENEFSGQISDGMWENSRHTEWLWRNVYVKLGDVTKVEVTSQWVIGRKSFGMTKELWECIGDRIIDENGFRDEKEAKAAWREIATAIYNASTGPEALELDAKLRREKAENSRNQFKSIIDEWKQVEGLKCDFKEDSYYIYGSLDFNEHEVKYTNGEVRKGHSYLFIHIDRNSQGDLKHEIQWHDTKFYAQPGKLLDTIQAIKDFDANLLALKDTPVSTLF